MENGKDIMIVPTATVRERCDTGTTGTAPAPMVVYVLLNRSRGVSPQEAVRAFSSREEALTAACSAGWRDISHMPENFPGVGYDNSTRTVNSDELDLTLVAAEVDA